MSRDVMGVQEVAPGYEFVAENSGVPAGYKQTEVGVIPEDWSNTRLDQLISFISYGFTNPMPTTEDGIYMLTAVDINNGKIQLNKARKTSIEAYQRLLTDKSRPKPNDILLTKDGTLGRLATVGTETVCINQSIAVIRTNDKADPNFLKLLLESAPYQKKMLEDAGGSTIKHIYITIVDKMHVGLPLKVGEQRAIATALDDVDALLEELDRLIAKKRDIKQAAMQQLLTGETRLPGFEGEWDRVYLGDLVDRLSNGAVYKPIGRGGVPITRIETIAHGCIDLERTGNAAWDTSLTQYELKTGDILFSHINSVDHIGKVAIVADVHRPIYHGMNLLLIRAKESYSSKYLFYWLDFEVTRQTMRALAKQAVSQASINTSELRTVEVYLPKRKEQDAIAVALSDMDAKIQALEQRRSKTAELKQGMMQELLTGRTRLV